MKRPMTILLIGASFVLSSCGSIYDIVSGRGVGSFSYVPGQDISKRSYPSFVYKDVASATRSGNAFLNTMPSEGQVNVLVIPVEFSGYSFTPSVLADIEKCFNGDCSTTRYWHSVSSFYKQSSFEHLNIHATFSDVYEIGKSPAGFIPYGAPSGTNSVSALVNEVVSWYKNATGDDMTSFDYDHDGYLDGVYLIYSCPDYVSAQSQSLRLDDTYWAYTSWMSNNYPSLTSPRPNSYIWASYDFMYDGVDKGRGVDAHTLIHETGHMLGLDDYYNYDSSDPDAPETKYKHYSPTGSLDMMDYNVLDHNAWSKFSLGWVKPYVVNRRSSFPVTIEIADSQSSGDFILIQDSESEYNGSAFDEYMMVELYTPTGLNELDSSTRYAGKYPLGFSMSGVKISHIDARLAHIVGENATYAKTVTKEMLRDVSKTSSYAVAASNTPSYSMGSEGYRLIHLMQSSGKNTLSNEGKEGNFNHATNNDLFVPETDHGIFTMKKFSGFFENGTLFNNGNPFPYSIKVNGILNTSKGAKASITIDKV